MAFTGSRKVPLPLPLPLYPHPNLPPAPDPALPRAPNPSYDEDTKELVIEQVSLILGPRFVVSFQEAGGDVFDGVRNRIRGGKGKIRNMGADYLAYALLDAVVDNYFLALEKIGDDLETIEEVLVGDPTPETLHRIHKLK